MLLSLKVLISTHDLSLIIRKATAVVRLVLSKFVSFVKYVLGGPRVWIQVIGLSPSELITQCRMEESLSYSFDADVGLFPRVASVAACTMGRSTIWIMGLTSSSWSLSSYAFLVPDHHHHLDHRRAWLWEGEHVQADC